MGAGWLPKVKVAMGAGCDKDPTLPKPTGPDVEFPKLNFGVGVSSADFVGAKTSGELIVSRPLLVAGWLPKVNVGPGVPEKDPLPRSGTTDGELPKLNFGIDDSSIDFVGAGSAVECTTRPLAVAD